MAQVTGTLTAVGQRSNTLFLRVGEQVTVNASRSGSGAWAAQLVRVIGAPPVKVEVIETFQATATGYTYRNTSLVNEYLAIQLREIGVGASVSYTIADVAGDQILQEWRAADGTLAFRITDQGAIGGVVGPTLNVKAFGAKGDGVTDDTAAIQAALDAAEDAGGGIVFVPEGDYGYRFLLIPANVTLMGAGRGVSTFARLATGGPENSLFGIRLVGDYATLRDCSAKGLWNPADPTTQTYDFNITVTGNGVSYTLVQNVETYNAHIGYCTGGIVGNAASYSAQNFNRVEGCHAHDTYDLGFGLVAKGTSDADTSVGNVLSNCWQNNSYATAGCEVRYQRAAQVVGFNTSSNLNTDLGAGVRLEETSFAQVIGVRASLCHMAVQVINDTTNCTISDLTARSCSFGMFVRHSANITLSDSNLYFCGVDGVRLAYSDGTAWTNNNQHVTVRGTRIIESNTYGVRVIGTGFTEAALADNGIGLVVDGCDISRTRAGHGMLIQAGGNFSVLNCQFEGNVGFAADGFGVVIVPPAPNGVTDNSKPAGGFFDGCKFVQTADQPNTISNWVGDFSARPAIGTVTVLGGGNLPNYAFASVEDGGVVARGAQAAIRTVAFADSPVAAVTRDYTIRCNATGGNIVVDLPAASTHPGGVYAIKKTDSSGNTVTITDNATDLIDGAGTLVLNTQWQSRIIQSNGTTWSVIGAYL